MPDAHALIQVRRILDHPLAGWAVAVVAVLVSMWLVYKVITQQVRALEQVQVNIAVQTAHTAAGVEGLRTLAAGLERLGGALHDHNRDEEQRHKANADRIDELHRSNVDRLDRISRDVRTRRGELGDC